MPKTYSVELRIIETYRITVEGDTEDAVREQVREMEESGEGLPASDWTQTEWVIDDIEDEGSNAEA